MMGGGTVYMSARRLVVASQRWVEPAAVRAGAIPGQATEIHAFDVSSPDRTSYVESGSVSGFLLDRWSLSEHRGDLRVATTEIPAWIDPSAGRESESFVTVLRSRNGGLVQVGRVGGLGRGERAYAVRFAGDLGFVVTFRQVDPLYAIDLARPERPAVAGVLKVRGYSAYLHPVGGDRLLGVGQDATDDGRVLGTQLSLFDVSDPRRLARLDAISIGPGSSEAEVDAHAFLYWPATRLVVLPLQVSGTRPFVGALALRIGSTRIDELGRIEHPAAGAGSVPVRRSLVVADRLFTFSERGVRANDLATLAGVAWLPLGS
jgi:uncharacterized secreted protein with C-terminal beta-propeller domain